jgi:D-xylose transport system ATP-binding protein
VAEESKLGGETDLDSQTPEGTPLLEMKSIGMNFPGVRALDGVSFDLHPGEIHALVGENGAGKSTLMKILGGVYPFGSYEGEIRIVGQLQRFRNVHDSAAAGVAVVFQELSLVPEMTVAENIFLGRAPTRKGVVQWNAIHAKASQLSKELQLGLDVSTPVGQLGIGKQQLVEVAKALSHEARILVLDEPTAALTDREAQTLFAILADLRQRGIGMIYISHRLEEVLRLSDRITVLRDGRAIATAPTPKWTAETMISQMVGREVRQLFPARKRTPGEVVLDARSITAKNSRVPGIVAVEGVSLKARRREVLGIAGLMGAGRTELLMSLFGCYPGTVTGEIRVADKEVRIESPADAIRHGIGLVTEDRKRTGLILEHTILVNVTLAALPRVSGKYVTEESREIAAADRVLQSLRLKAAHLFSTVGTLSGGNQQKVVLGKWLLTEPKVLLLDEPTRGIDVGAKQEIYAEIDELARSGLAVVLVSSELPEVLGLSDRVMVMHAGRVTGEFPVDKATPELVMACATGQANQVA